MTSRTARRGGLQVCLCTKVTLNPTIQQLRATSVRLYREIRRQENRLKTGIHLTGATRATRSAGRMAELYTCRGVEPLYWP
ncbi:MAG: hypothetical protein AAF317_11835 [Pseudomonadota bacterium]